MIVALGALRASRPRILTWLSTPPHDTEHSEPTGDARDGIADGDVATDGSIP